MNDIFSAVEFVSHRNFDFWFVKSPTCSISWIRWIFWLVEQVVFDLWIKLQWNTRKKLSEMLIFSMTLTWTQWPWYLNLTWELCYAICTELHHLSDWVISAPSQLLTHALCLKHVVWVICVMQSICYLPLDVSAPPRHPAPPQLLVSSCVLKGHIKCI